MEPREEESWEGRLLTLEVGPVAHGGHCVARVDGRVVFVRHTLPGEQVRARVTEGHSASRFLRADAVEVLEASPDRVAARCPVAGPGGCGGCDWQHVSVAGQRRLKADVVTEQLRRLAGLDVPVVVEPV
ncbi:MAG TPA: TRAM domain-containing protein, partial [Actinomycetales bacterium]|nr:TRAM domain-containing protein [Actinomycetales bacterium]